MFEKIHSKLLILFCIALASAFLGLWLNAMPTTANPVQAKTESTVPPQEGNGFLVVSLFEGGHWHEVGMLAFDEHPTEQSINLPPLAETAPVLIRVAHTGQTSAHLDTILLDGQPPSGISGQAEGQDLALQKLSAPNFDLIALTGRTVEVEFLSPPTSGQLTLVARIAPDQISTIPFQFPMENTHYNMRPDSAFYAYAWDSNPGTLTIDGEISAEDLGQPLMREWAEPGTGHPAAYATGWVRNDAKTLYVALDFASDNTMDGDKDYAKVYVNTPGGLRSFKISVPEQTWGQPGFTYTPYAAYQHKVYEFAIPLAKLGLDDIQPGDALPLAFALYGTAAPPNDYPGELDPSFGSGGVVTTSVGGSPAKLHDLVLQPDGKLVAAGYADIIGLGDAALLARYNTNGSLDSSFGDNGMRITTPGIGTNDNRWRGVVLQDDGSIVTAGSLDSEPAVARYTITGSLDTAFGNNGVVTVSLSTGTFNAVALQDDGKIVAAGQTGDTVSDFLVARYNSDGSPDSSFGTAGITTTHWSDWDFAYGLVIQDDGKIVVAGWNGSFDFALVRYTITGTLDTDFGTNGVATADFGDAETSYGLALQEDGKLVAVGQTGNDDFALARFNSDGSLDTSFGVGGMTTTDFGSRDIARDIAIYADGKLAVVGSTYDLAMSVARYHPDGSLDSSFGTHGRANDVAGTGNAIVIEPDSQKIVSGGDRPDDGLFVLERFMHHSSACYVEANGDDVTDFSSHDASAVQDAVDAASSGDLLKVAGTCAGVQVVGGITQTVYIQKNITLQGGYTATNWLAAPDPETYSTTLDASRNGRVVVLAGNITVTLDSLTITGADYEGLGGAFTTTYPP